jgi:Flp pilus assembly pilin Flp
MRASGASVMKALLLQFVRDDSGRGVAEALLATGTGLLIVPTANDVGAKLAAVFEKLTKALH